MHADRHTSRRVYTIFWTLTTFFKFLNNYVNLRFSSLTK